MRFAIAPLGEIAPAKPISLGRDPEELVWQLNLDHIEADTGLLLKRERKPFAKAGTSTHGFDNRHVLYSKLRPYLNKVLVPDEEGIGTTELVPMLPDPGRLDRGYLAHYLMTKRFVAWITDHSSGAKMPRATMADFWAHEIPLPPLPEQRRIAAILDRADAIRRKRQHAIELADQFLRSVFLDLFGDPVTNPKGWDQVKLGKHCGVGSSKRVFVEEFVDAGIPFYRGTEIGQLGDGKVIEPHLFIARDHYEALKEHSGVPQAGDLLLPSICHDGRIWKVETDQPFYFKDGRVLWIKVDHSEFNSDYLRSFLSFVFSARYASIASGTTFAELKIVNLKQLFVLQPPLAVQEKYSKIVAKANVGLYREKQGLDVVGRLFDSLSQRAFSGEM